jgi:hypothetical protein
MLLLACCAALLAAPGAAHAVAPAEAIRLLNLQRTANGIPGDLAEGAGLSEGCALHVDYIALNGGALTHDEDPSKPGYSPRGARQTLDSTGAEVLATAPVWSETANPWLSAPIHRYLLFDPEATVAGYGEDHGIACMRVRGGRAPATGPELHSVPGDGRKGVPFTEVAREAPYTPQDLAGLPAGQPTGPAILLFTRGLRGTRPLSASAFSIAGPQGPVDARLVTEGTSNAVGTGAWFRGGGVLIGVVPLAPLTTYVARVTWHRDAEESLPATDVEQVVTFETDARPNTIDVAVVSKGPVTIRVATPAPNPTLRLTGPGELTDIEALKNRTIRYAALQPGKWTACAKSGGRQVGYVPVTTCAPFTAFGKVQLRFGLDRGMTTVALNVPPIARGRRARVTVSRYKRPCRTVDGRSRCTRQAIGRAGSFAITLRTGRMRLAVPRRRDGVKVSVRVVLAAFKAGGAPYLRTDVRRTWE